MLPLSVALRRSTAAVDVDILEAAYRGALRTHEIEQYEGVRQALSHDSLCSYMVRNLHRVFPELGASVRFYLRLAKELETDGLIPVARSHQTQYRREIHVSLWRVLTLLQDRGVSRGRVADMLAAGGL